MARVELEAERISVIMSPLDEVLALHGSLHIPYSHVRSVRHEPVPEELFRGIRVGTNLPGVKVAGTFFTLDGVIFYDFHDPSRCLIFELDHETYRKVVVEVDRGQDPATLAGQIRDRIG